MPPELSPNFSMESTEALTAEKFDMRAHHARMYAFLIEKIVDGKTLKDSSLLSAAEMAAAVIDLTANNIWGMGEDFPPQYSHNLKPDDTMPLTYFNDTISTSGEYMSANRDSFMRFLTAPSDLPVVLGPEILDDFCKNCHFGKSKVGLHCQTTSVDGELDASLGILLHVTDFLSDSRVQPKVQEDPKRFAIQRKIVKVENAPTTFIGDNVGLQLTMPLGLLRDVFTYEATRGQMVGYGELIKSKCLPELVNSYRNIF